MSTSAVNLLIEPFYGGSHKQLIDLIYRTVPDCHLVTMTAKKWHWRSRVAALHLAQSIPVSKNYRVLFCSSVLNLAELIALRPDLAPLKKIIYFHENQLIYPVRDKKERDVQHGYNQILSSLVADRVVFNSHYNMESFLFSIDRFLRILPDYRPKNLTNQIRPKCQVVYFPVQETGVLPVNQDLQSTLTNQNSESGTQRLTTNHSTDSQSTLSNQNSDTGTQRLTANHSTDPQSTLSNQNSDSGTQRCSTNHSTDSQSTLSNQNSSSETQRLTANHSTDSERVSTSQVLLSENDKLGAKQNENQTEDLANPFPEPDRRLVTPQGQGSVPRHNLSNQLETPLHIVWAHRWEHDKGPELFFDTVKSLHKEGCQFKLSVLGEQFTDNLEVFEISRPILQNHIVHWGYLPSKSEFLRVLESADVAVSTALHEFFGVSMLEAVQMQCYPLCPNRLVYPEIYPKRYLYNTENQLLKTLRRFCHHPKLVREHKVQIDIAKFSWKERKMEFLDLFCV